MRDIDPFIVKNECSLTSEIQQHGQIKQHLHGLPFEDSYDPNTCAGCREKLKEGQALIALDRQWHISCFRFVKQKYNTEPSIKQCRIKQNLFEGPLF